MGQVVQSLTVKSAANKLDRDQEAAALLHVSAAFYGCKNPHLCFTEVTLHSSIKHLLINAFFFTLQDISCLLDHGRLSLSSALNVPHHVIVRHYESLSKEFLSWTNGLAVKSVCCFLMLEVSDTDRGQHRNHRNTRLCTLASSLHYEITLMHSNL